MTSTASRIRCFDINFGVKLGILSVRMRCRGGIGSLECVLEVLLKVQYSLQTLSGTIADGITLRRGAERPGTLTLMSVILPKVHSIALDLCLIQPLESFHATCTIRLLGSESGFDNSLGNESYIPQLTPVGTGHHHAFLRKPHKIGSSSSMLLERIAFRTIDVPPDYEVHHLVNGPKVLKVGVIVFGKYKVVNPLEGGTTKRGKGTLLVLGEDDIQAIEKSGMGRI